MSIISGVIPISGPSLTARQDMVPGELTNPQGEARVLDRRFLAIAFLDVSKFNF